MNAPLRLAWLAALLLADPRSAAAQPVQPNRPAPIFTGQSLPEPPHQREAWPPLKTSLPEKCVSSIQAVISYGFANPRGCEYREVEIPCGSVSGGGHVLKTHAWVIPSKDNNDTQRFAVSWSGLIYAAAAVGEPADLKADLAELVKPPKGDYRSMAPMESDLVWHVNRSELKVCTLLLLGETEAAEQLWQNLQNSKYAPPLDADPYLRFAHEFAWANYDRAVCAHIRGDDVISFLSAQAAIRLRDSIEKDAAARGLKRPTDGQGKPTLYLDFLRNIDLLLADGQRRAKTTRPERALALGIDKFPDQKLRIAALIRDLEEVNVTQNSQPGTVFPSEDLIVKALVKEGEAAIDPLLECFENDNRLTRSVGFGRSFHTGRYFIAVQDAAFDAICDILKVRTFGPATEHRYLSDFWDEPKRDDVAKEIRAYWNKVRGVAELDRWYQTLADDRASPRQWLETVEKFAQPVPRAAGAPVLPRMATAMSLPRPLVGEPLREKEKPTVTELLCMRADEVAAQHPHSTLRIHALSDACEITLALSRWDKNSAGPQVRKRMEQCNVLFADGFYATYAKRLAPTMSRLCAAGIDAGDEWVANECGKWLQSLSPEKIESGDAMRVFYALSRSPEHPKLSAAAKVLFLKESAFCPLHSTVVAAHFSDYVAWPLIGVPVFREMVKQELRNTATSEATLKTGHQDGEYAVEFRTTRLTSIITEPLDTNFKITEQPLRICDLYAWACRKLEGMPIFEPYWPLERRDEAITSIVGELERFGDCYRLLSSVPADRLRYPFREPEFHLPKLDHSATFDDVKNGQAIFSLQDGKSEVRQVALPMFPHMARWKTLDKFPVRYRGQKEAPTEYDRSGYVWQAEEILVGGQWQRFYGFVGNHIIAKVPADEIELLENRGTDRFLRW